MAEAYAIVHMMVVADVNFFSGVYVFMYEQGLQVYISYSGGEIVNSSRSYIFA